MADLLCGITGAEIVRGIFHAFAVFAYVKVFFLKRRVTTLEEKIGRMEARVSWALKE